MFFLTVAFVLFSQPLPASNQFFVAFKLLPTYAFLLFFTGTLTSRALNLFPRSSSYFFTLTTGAALSYLLLTIVCISCTVLKLPLNAAILLLGLWATACSVILFLRPNRAASENYRRSRQALLFFALVIFCAGAYGWFLESPIEGEEVVELVSARKILESPFLSIKGIMHVPDAFPTYIFMPYCFLIALIAKISGTSIFVTYVKLRSAFIMLSAAAFLEFVRLCFRKNSIVVMAAITLFIFATLDPLPLSWPASLLPINRRGSFAAGVLFPQMIVLAFWIAKNRKPNRFAWLACLGALLIALFFTHALEAMFFLYFVAVLAAHPFIFRKFREFRNPSFSVALTSVSCSAVFIFVHSKIVSHIQAHHAPFRAQESAAIYRLLDQPISALFGAAADKATYVFATLGEVSYFVTAAAISLPFLLFFGARLATLFWLLFLLPALIYGVPLLWHVVLYLSSPEIYFASAYFGFFGLALFISAAAFLNSRLVKILQKKLLEKFIPSFRWPIVCLASLFISSVVIILLIRPYITGIFAAPWMNLVLVVTICPALYWFGQKRAAPKTDNRTDFRTSRTTYVSFTCFVIPLVLLLKSSNHDSWNGDRPTILGLFRRQMSVPSVIDWNDYYPVLQNTSRPTIDLPWSVVLRLREVLPPLSTIAYDPGSSYAIPMLINIYIVNPGYILSTDLVYFHQYLKYDQNGREVHPLFNQGPELTALELSFLKVFPIDYIVSNPKYDLLLRHKLKMFVAAGGIQEVAPGYSVFRIERSKF